MRISLIVFLLFLFTACDLKKSNLSKYIFKTSVDTTFHTKSYMQDQSPSIEYAHPNAKRLMNEEFYWSPVEETAPFGSDDGADTYASFAMWRPLHKSENLNIFLNEHIQYWGYPFFDFKETRFEKLKPYIDQSEIGSRFLSGIDAAILAIAFGQLYQEGTIEKDFNELARISIQRQLIPELLNEWDETYRVTRETQLNKMLDILKQLD